MKCLNCENEFKGHFCNQCGQKATVKAITLAGVLSDVFRMLTNVDRGLLFNYINLTRKPQATISGYLSGKRIGVFPPIQYAILGVTILTLLDHYLGQGFPSLTGHSELVGSFKDSPQYNLGQNFGKILKGNLKFFLPLIIFFFSIPAKLFYKKFNFAEHLAIQAFILGHAAFFTIFLFPFKQLTVLANPVFYLVLLIWNFLFFFSRKEIVASILSAIFIFLIGMGLFILIPVLLFVLLNIS